MDDDGQPTGLIRAVDPEDLPVDLPHLDDFKPHGRPEPPLAKAPAAWLYPTIDGKQYRRETNTMPQWAGSCWYYLRYLDPLNERQAVAPEKEKYWMPVDLYIGGAEHAVLHLMYSRFWHHLLYDLGFVSTPEPFKKLINQGMILGEDNQKMSKSRGNVINPDKVIADYGADSMRLYEMFMGPLEATKPWSMQGVEGVHRFLNRLWRVVIDDATGQLSETVQPIPMDEETQRLLHQTIQKVGEDIETFGFNTAISQMMIFVNHLSKLTTRPREAVESLVLVLAPFAPHISEELWRRLGHPDSLAYVPWPAFDPARTRARTVELVVQVFGKIKDRIVVDADADAATIEAAALASEKVQAALAGKPVKKAIVVQGRLVNLVV